MPVEVVSATMPSSTVGPGGIRVPATGSRHRGLRIRAGPTPIGGHDPPGNTNIPTTRKPESASTTSRPSRVAVHGPSLRMYIWPANACGSPTGAVAPSPPPPISSTGGASGPPHHARPDDAYPAPRAAITTDATAPTATAPRLRGTTTSAAISPRTPTTASASASHVPTAAGSRRSPDTAAVLPPSPNTSTAFVQARPRNPVARATPGSVSRPDPARPFHNPRTTNAMASTSTPKPSMEAVPLHTEAWKHCLMNPLDASRHHRSQGTRPSMANRAAITTNTHTALERRVGAAGGAEARSTWTIETLQPTCARVSRGQSHTVRAAGPGRNAFSEAWIRVMGSARPVGRLQKQSADA